MHLKIIVKYIAFLFGGLFTIITFLSHLSPSFLLPILTPLRTYFFDPLSLNVHSWRMFAGGGSVVQVSKIQLFDKNNILINETSAQPFQMSLYPSGIDSFFNSITTSPTGVYTTGFLHYYCRTIPKADRAAFLVARIPWYIIRDKGFEESANFRVHEEVKCEN